MLLLNCCPRCLVLVLALVLLLLLLLLSCWCQASYVH
jgi:hypothetical protein